MIQMAYGMIIILIIKIINIINIILQTVRPEDIIISNKTCQGYARKRILKPAGYFFLRDV
jgi:hypothetical protein